MKICFFGAASNAISDKYKEIVYKLAAKLAQRGHSLIFGAGDGGLMGAAARGFHDNGQEVIGVAPAFFMEETIEALYKESDILLYTESMATRKSLMEFNADAFIIVPGGIGTYDEFFQVLTMKQLKQVNKPIVLFNAYDFYTPLDTLLQNAMKEKFLRSDTQELCRCYTENDIENIINYIETPVTEDDGVVSSDYGI